MNNQLKLKPQTDRLNQGNVGNNFAFSDELQRPLENIYLSIDMFKTVIQNGDQEIYLDVIARNVSRLESLVSQLITDRPGGGQTAASQFE